MTIAENPKARVEGMVIQEMPDELLVFDSNTNKAHCLNDTALKVWTACNGENSVTDIAKMFEGEDFSKKENLVLLAIDQLRENDLLENDYSLDMNGQTRRNLIKKIGLASIIALPVISSLSAPTSVLAAGSCACTAPAECLPQTTCPSTVNCAPTGICSP